VTTSPISSSPTSGCLPLVTALASLEHKTLCEELGCDAYFTKPVSARAFLEAVQDSFARERPERLNIVDNC
jgi:DNA-binding response OmpR family regulator